MTPYIFIYSQCVRATCFIPLLAGSDSVITLFISNPLNFGALLWQSVSLIHPLVQPGLTLLSEITVEFICGADTSLF